MQQQPLVHVICLNYLYPVETFKVGSLLHYVIPQSNSPFPRLQALKMSIPVSKSSTLSNIKGKLYHRTGHESPEWNRYIDLLFLQPRPQMVGGVQRHFSGRFKPGNDHVPIVEEAGLSLELARRSAENLSSPNGIRSPDSPIQLKA